MSWRLEVDPGAGGRLVTKAPCQWCPPLGEPQVRQGPAAPGAVMAEAAARGAEKGVTVREPRYLG